MSGSAAPGTLSALMGESGAGKTTLLDMLARRKTYGLTQGSVLVNGRQPGKVELERCFFFGSFQL